MKSLFCFAVMFFASTTFSFAQDSCASGRCLKAPVKVAANVVGGTLGVASEVVGGAVSLAGNAVVLAENTVVATAKGVKTVVVTPVRRVANATQSAARVTFGAVKRPFRRVSCR